MMSDLISLEHISDNLTLYEVDGTQKEELRSVLNEARKCVKDENIQSSDCRIAISKVITQQVKVMLPKLVDNLNLCYTTRNYPSNYETDYFFPPVGCSRHATSILVAHKLLWNHLDQKKNQ